MSQPAPPASATVKSRSANRPERLTVLAFLADAATEQVVQDGLGDLVAHGLDIRRGTVRTAITAMAKLPTPEVLIVDISSEEQPLNALAELSDVVEPGVRVLVIGNTDDVDFYRHITRGMGVMEYIFKPITRESVARYFAPLITRSTIGQDATRGGRVIALIGARGGTGATTIAANLAWYFGVAAKRHTVFLEADLHLGSGAMLLGAKTSNALRVALETPDRIDAAFIEAAVQPVAERLQVLAAAENPQAPCMYEAGAARRLIDALRVRYNFIVLDVPFLPVPWHRDLLELAHHRVIVLEPSLASVRDTQRLLALPNGPWQPQSPTLVLNRHGRPGGLTRKQIEDALHAKIDVLIADNPKQLSEMANPGEPAAASRLPFRQSIIELSREVGFVSGDPSAPATAAGSAVQALLQKLLAPRGPWA